MADLLPPLADADTIVKRLNLKGEYYDTVGDDNDVQAQIETFILGVSAELQGRIGGDYSTTDPRSRAVIRQAELLLAQADVLENLDVIRASAREDNYPPEYEDYAANAEKCAGWRARAEVLIEGFVGAEEIVEGALAGEAGINPRGFAIGGIMIDETEEDDYTDIDFGADEEEP